MKADQKLTPKYWVVHDPNTDGVHINSLSKSYLGACDNFMENMNVVDRKEFSKMIEEGKLEVSLVEIKFVKTS